MELKERQKKYLRRLGHDLHPLVTVADKGLSKTVLTEIQSVLTHHELIKVKFRLGDRDLRQSLIQDMLDQTNAALIQRIGNVALVYRANPKEPKVQLPH